jgi:hypothetical protein
MSKLFVKHWPLLASVVILFVTTSIISSLLVLRENGHLIYALDDPYIQMAMAKNFALHGVWGVTRFAFTSASSSPFWTFLIAIVYLLLGVGEAAPFYLSWLAGALLLAVVYGVLRWYRVSSQLAFWVLAILVFVAPLPTLVLVGSEHPLHAALTILLTFFAARLLSDESPCMARGDRILLLALAPLLTMVRYEGMFLILVLAALFCLRGRWPTGLRVGLAGFSSILLYGAIGLAHGWSWLPSSILVKGNFPRFTSFSVALDTVFGPAYSNMQLAPHLLALVAAALFLALYTFDKLPTLWESRQVMTAIFVLIALAHFQFCAITPFFRYESYLVALGTVVIVAQLAGLLPQKLFGTPGHRALAAKHAGGLLLAGFFFFPLAVRSTIAMALLPQASKNIYEQQYQMARFIKTYYEGSTIALNDIGAVNFFADVRCLDLAGLGTYEVTQLMRHRQYHTQDMLRLARQAGVKVALLYDNWYAPIGGLPRDWVWVGQWTIPDNVVTGGDTVSIYAVDESETASLLQNLKDFAPRLPSDVRQSGRYLY